MLVASHRAPIFSSQQHPQDYRLQWLEDRQGEAERAEPRTQGRQALFLVDVAVDVDVVVHRHQHVAMGHARLCFRQLDMWSRIMLKAW